MEAWVFGVAVMTFGGVPRAGPSMFKTVRIRVDGDGVSRDLDRPQLAADRRMPP